ncbi:MAG TPA: hypothetical protein DHU81_16435 [Hyphomonas sp.]|nr:hypothetical protein [Hyphomonas sp.]
MNDSKPLLKSKTVWAQIVGLAAALLTLYGVEIDEAAQGQIVEAVGVLMLIGSQVYAIWSRKVADTTIKGIIRSPEA